MAEFCAPVGVSAGPISASALASAVGARTDGAIVTFEGRVRARNQGLPVLRLHYESYDAMAVEVLREIADETRDRFSVGEVAVQHRAGSLEVGEVSVAIAVCAPHRAAAFDAVRYVIEQIKTRLPIWKREEYADGTSRWLDGAVPPGAPGSGADPGTGAGT